MIFTLVRNALMASANVTALVGSGAAARIESLVRPQALASLPAITVQVSSLLPVNGIDGWNSLDSNSVQIDEFAETYTQVHQLADACRAAMQDAGYIMDTEFDNFEPETEIAGVYRITQLFNVWTSPTTTA